MRQLESVDRREFRNVLGTGRSMRSFGWRFAFRFALRSMSVPLRVPAPLLVLFLVVGSASTQADTQQAAGAVTILDGQATVVRAGQSPTALRLGDDVFPGDRIMADAQSFVGTFLGGRASLTMREFSTLTITAKLGEAALSLDSGTIAYAVPRELMPPGETHEIRTPNAVVRARDTIVVVEVERRSGVAGVSTTVVVTHIDVLRGSVSASSIDGPLVEICVGQGMTIVGHVFDPVRPVRPSSLSVLFARGARSTPGGALGIDPTPMTCSSSPPVSSDWALLIDRGNGFETWVDTAAQGYVAGDGSYEGVTLSACDAVATTLARQGAKVACARSPWTDLQHGGAAYRDDGRLIARGPLVGRLIVYESGRKGSDWSWRLMIHRGKGFELWVGQKGYVPVDYSFENVGPVACEVAATWLQRQHEWVACVRSPPRAYHQYRDVQGHLLVEGPFAGGMFVP